MANLRITLRRSPIGAPEVQKRTVRALGLTRTNMTVVRPDNEAVRGMVRAVEHLVEAEPYEPQAIADE